MNPEELAAYLEVIKSFAEPTVQMVFEATVQAVYIRNLVGLIGLGVLQVLLVLGAVLLVIASVSMRRSYDTAHEKLADDYHGWRRYQSSHSSDEYVWPLLGATFLLIIVAFTTVVGYPDLLANVLVPEAAAIQIMLGR